MNRAAKILSLLWNPFIEKIESGDPVFFCFYTDYLREVFDGTEFETVDLVQLINDVANNFYIQDSDGVYLKQSALVPIWEGFSPALILICQQVLAVEEMVREQDGHSEYAYFPRLRKMISKDIGESSSNPFDFDEFEGVWRRLAAEIRSINGHSANSITFRFGIEQGVNKARSFPLSQALLNGEDLNKIVRKIGIEEIKFADDSRLWSMLRSERRILKRRPQRLLGLSFLRERIVNQVRGYAEKVDVSKWNNETSKEIAGRKLELRFFKESLDWLTDEFRSCIVDISSDVQIDESEIIHSEIRNAIGDKGFMILPQGPFGDNWIRTSQEIEIQPGEIFLLVGYENDFANAYQILKTCIPNFEFNSDCVTKYPFGRGISILEIRWPSIHQGLLVVKSGSVLNKSRVIQRTTNQWIGGIPLDARRTKFLRESLPNYLQVGTLNLSLDSIVKVNDKFLTFEAFKKSLTSLTNDQAFNIQFSNGVYAVLAVGVCRGDRNDRMGFRLDDLGNLSPSLDRVGIGDRALIGYMESTIATKSYGPEICAMVLRELKNGVGEDLTEVQIAAINNAVSNSVIPIEVKAIVKQLLHLNPKLSKEFINKLSVGS